jgi:hypothetical protein
VIEPLRPARGGFLRPFGCAWFIQEFLLGNGPTGSPIIDPDVGAPMVDIHRHYKESLKRDEGSKGTSQETIERMHIPTKSPLKMPLKIGKRKQLLHHLTAPTFCVISAITKLTTNFKQIEIV